MRFLFRAIPFGTVLTIPIIMFGTFAALKIHGTWANVPWWLGLMPIWLPIGAGVFAVGGSKLRDFLGI